MSYAPFLRKSNDFSHVNSYNPNDNYASIDTAFTNSDLMIEFVDKINQKYSDSHRSSDINSRDSDSLDTHLLEQKAELIVDDYINRNTTPVSFVSYNRHITTPNNPVVENLLPIANTFDDSPSPSEPVEATETASTLLTSSSSTWWKVLIGVIIIVFILYVAWWFFGRPDPNAVTNNTNSVSDNYSTSMQTTTDVKSTPTIFTNLKNNRNKISPIHMVFDTSYR